jgi:hypothetical protein
MTPRRLPLSPDTIYFHQPLHPTIAARMASVGWTRKLFALALHMACLALFGLFVVWPVAAPIARGELEREFRPVLQAWSAWTACNWSPAALVAQALSGHGCER